MNSKAGAWHQRRYYNLINWVTPYSNWVTPYCDPLLTRRSGRPRSPKTCSSAYPRPRRTKMWPARAPAITRAGACAYSPSKVIHRWRGGPSFPPPQPTVKNFGGGAKMTCEKLRISLNRRVEHAGSGRRIVCSNAATFQGRRSLRDPAPCRQGTLRTFRLQVQTGQRRTSISASIRQGRRAQHQP